LGGCSVFVHPPEVDLKSEPPEGSLDRKHYFKAWFWELTDKCVCEAPMPPFGPGEEKIEKKFWDEAKYWEARDPKEMKHDE
jgi:hypothetical protein